VWSDQPGASTQEWQAYAAQQEASAGYGAQPSESSGRSVWSDQAGASTQEWRAYAGQQQAASQQASWPGASSSSYGRPSYGAGRAPAPADDGRPGFTVGLVVAGVGVLLLLASLFTLDFVTFSAGDVSESFPLSDLRSDDLVDTSEAGRGGQYIEFGFVPGLIVVAGAVFVQFLDRDHPARRGLTVATVIVMSWHLLAMFQWDTGPGESVSPALGAWIGVLGYLCLAASPWLTQRLSRAR
jgi:hypothetical protein